MRVSNWPAVLAEFIESKRSVPFAWGANDCCMFSADWILQVIGIDYAAEYRGKYATAAGAKRKLNQVGGLEGLMANQPFPEITPARAQRGDIVWFEMPTGPSIGVCIGKFSAFAGANGVVFQLTLSARRAWRIG